MDPVKDPDFGTKKKLLEDPGSCLNKSTERELVFLLAERDPVAAETIDFWANRRVARGIDAPDDEKIKTAAAVAEMMDASPVRIGDKGKVVSLPVRNVSTGTGSREFSEYIEITERDVVRHGYSAAVEYAASLAASRAMSRILFESMSAGFVLQHTYSVRITFHDSEGGKADRPSQTIPKGGTARLTSYTIIQAKPAVYIDESGRPQNYPRPQAPELKLAEVMTADEVKAACKVDGDSPIKPHGNGRSA